MYKEVLENGDTTTVTMINIRSSGHVLHTQQVTKTALSAYDDKRYILDTGIDTLAYGHYKIL